MTWLGTPGEPVDEQTYGVPSAPSEEPRRFTPILMAAAVVAAIGGIAIVAIFLSGAGAPSASPTARGGSGAVPSVGGSAPPGSGAVACGGGQTFGPDEVVASLCAAPVPTFAETDPAVIEALRVSCSGATAAVLATGDIDPDAVLEAAWRRPETPSPSSGGEVFVTIDGERRVRRYVASLDVSSGTFSAVRLKRVRAIPDDVVFRWPVVRDDA